MLRSGNTYSNLPSENRPRQIKKWKLNQNPPHSYYKWKNDLGAYTQDRVTGLWYKRLTSPFTGNYMFMSSNGKQFSDYYTAIQYQNLINYGYCPEAIDQVISHEPDYTYDVYSLVRSMHN